MPTAKSRKRKNPEVEAGPAPSAASLDTVNPNPPAKNKRAKNGPTVESEDAPVAVTEPPVEPVEERGPAKGVPVGLLARVHTKPKPRPPNRSFFAGEDGLNGALWANAATKVVSIFWIALEKVANEPFRPPWQ